MSKLIKIDDSYKDWVQGLATRFRQCQLKAAVRVNEEMLRYYWALGKDIVKLQAESKWGDGFFDNLSLDLMDELPGIKGFSPRNLRYMKSFYLLYNQLLENLPQAEANLYAIPWGHHKYIMDRCQGDAKKALFFVQKTIENGWSRSVLLNFLDTNLYERQGKAITNFEQTLPATRTELAQQMTKDPYNFDFLSLTETYQEKELKEALTENITSFLVELGTGFAYMGREYRLQIGQKEQFVDLLFYHARLHCYVVIEVKITEFSPAHLGQLSAYVTAVNHLLRTSADNETIGLLICKTKDNVYAQYSLEGYKQPMGISEYELSHFLPQEVRSSLPSIEEIENELKD